MEKRTFYRVANTESEQGLWYDFKGNFTGLIHNKFTFCKNTDLPMPYDPELIGWLSAADSLESLKFWFTDDDIKELGKYGFVITVYEAVDYKMYKNHWVISQETSKITGYIK